MTFGDLMLVMTFFAILFLVGCVIADRARLQERTRFCRCQHFRTVSTTTDGLRFCHHCLKPLLTRIVVRPTATERLLGVLHGFWGWCTEWLEKKAGGPPPKAAEPTPPADRKRIKACTDENNLIKFPDPKE